MAITSILVIGATGRTGIAILQAASASRCKKTVHAFARTPSKLTEEETSICTTITKGDARSKTDVMQALEASRPTHIIMCVGIPDSLAPSDIREATAYALIAALREKGSLEETNVAVISALGAGGSFINFGLGAGSLVMWILRNGLRDHDRQEEAFVDAFSSSDDLRSRLLIVRPTGLTETKTKKRGILVLGDERSPTWRVDRDAMATWLVHRICSGEVSFGGVVAITGHKR